MSRRMFTTLLAAPVVVAVVLIAVLASWPSALQNHATAAGPYAVGLDFNTAGTPANGNYGGTPPTFENCISVAPGATVNIDVYALNVDTLAAFSSNIQYTQAYVKITAVNVNMFMGSQVGSTVSNDSNSVPDTDGLYYTAAHDEGNVSGDTGSGVLARITFQGIAPGIATVSIPEIDYLSDGTIDTGVLLRRADGSIINDTSPADGFYDGPWNPGPGLPTGTIAVQSDSDGDGVPTAGCGGSGGDNCPSVANPTQADMDGDGLGDACDGDPDGDYYWTTQETAMGSNPNLASSTPEVCDGIDNDGDGQVDEGFSFAGTSAPDCTEAGIDSDGDGTPNTSDTDDDNDGLADTFEAFARTDTLRKCANPMTPYIWWAEFGSGANTAVTISDVLQFTPYFNSSAGSPTTRVKYNRRFDWNSDNAVTIVDVVKVNAAFNKHCPPLPGE